MISNMTDTKIRLNKCIASQGICSRRKADEFIERGKVRVNGAVVKELGTKVDPDRDIVAVTGWGQINKKTKKQDQDGPIYILLHKPRGYVCTTKKFKGEKNVLDLVDLKERIYPVGRLDKDSEGLLILTNDGEFTNRLTHPSFQHEKEYEVTLSRALTAEDLETIKRGVSESGENLPVKQVELIEPKVARIILTEGKKRHIRRIFGSLDYKVTRLLRTRIDSYELADLKPGAWTFIQVDKKRI